jgi:hypothetical protein
MNVAAVQRRARPKHRPNRTISRLSTRELWVSVVRVARAEARQRAMCNAASTSKARRQQLKGGGEGTWDIGSSGGGFQPAVQRAANAVAANVR